MTHPSIRVAMHPLSPGGVGPRIGFFILRDTNEGLQLEPALPDLRPFGVGPGEHGLHVHEHGSLESGRGKNGVVAGLAAGDHFDPLQTRSHQGPHGDGHLGDLPRIEVGADGVPRASVVAPRVRLAQVMGRSLILHEGADNYTDDPPNGGGARRAIGGVITSACPYCEKDTTTRDRLLMLGFGAVAFGVAAYYIGADSKERG
jgi:Cu-Zn family superoxide dismutase